MASTAISPEASWSAAAEVRPLRIVLFMFDFALTGVVRNAVRLANGLAAEGHEVILLVCREDGRDRHMIDAGIRIETLPADRDASPKSRGLALAAAIGPLRRRLRDLQPDILMSAGNHGHLPVLVASLGMKDMRRVLRISNEPDHIGDTGLMRQVRNLLLRLMVRGADRLLLVSRHLARHPVLASALEQGKVAFTPNGVDIANIDRLKRQPCAHPWIADRDIPLVVSVGRLAQHKNFATLIRAVALANAERPLRLLIVGGGTEAQRQKLMALAEELGIADRIDLVGEQPNPFPFVAGASAFVLPSLWEGCSNALLEALACEVPVVASLAAGNAQELLGYGRFGLLIDPASASDMAEAILWQTGPDPVRPGQRAWSYDAHEALARACAAVTGAARERAHGGATVIGRPARTGRGRRLASTAAR